MPMKETVNAALQRATGYRLTKETPEQRRQAVKRARAQARAKARADARAAAQRRAAQAAETRAARRAEAARERAERIARGDDLPTHYDDRLRDRIVRVRGRTMTGHVKLQALIEATDYVVRQQIPGDVVECGVWRGGSMQAVALTLLEHGDTERDLHLFDTFEGMPPPSEHDTRTRNGTTVSAEELLATSDKESRMWAIASLEDVRQGMAETGYPADRLHYHRGLVEETIPEQAPERISLLRLDTDWYESTRHELEHLYHRLSPGGVLIFDDYGDWDGARKATDEWMERTGEPLFLVPMASGRIAVKPR